MKRCTAVDGRPDWLVAGVGAAMMLTAGFAGSLALQPSPAHAAQPAAATAEKANPEKAAPERDGRQAHAEARKKARAEWIKANDKHLSTEQVRDIVAGRLAQSGNPNLKVGKAPAKENNVVAVEIVTKTGALVDTREISTQTGRPPRAHKFEADGDRDGRHGRGMKHGRRGMDHGMDRGFGRGMDNDGPRHGRGRGGRGGGEFGQDRDLNLTADQARKLAEARLILQGNPNIKVGAVKEKDADTITIDIVATDNSLVMQRNIDRHTGRRKHPGT